MSIEATKLIDFFPANDGRGLKRTIIVRQAVILGVVVIVYLINRLVFRDNSTQGFPLSIVACDLPDLMAPIALFSASNIVFAIAGFQLRKLLPILLFCIIAAFVWEFIAPVVVPWSVTDPYDIIAYLAGGIIYWLLNWLIIPMNT